MDIIKEFYIEDNIRDPIKEFIYPSKLMIAHTLIAIISLCLLGYTIFLTNKVRKDNKLSDFHMVASLICIAVNILF